MRVRTVAQSSASIVEVEGLDAPRTLPSITSTFPMILYALCPMPYALYADFLPSN